MRRIIAMLVGCYMSLVFSVPMAGAISDVEAEAEDDSAEVSGEGAVPGANIEWEGEVVGVVDSDGEFEFNAPLPSNCIGELSDGVMTLDVTVEECTPLRAFPATGQTTAFKADKNNGAGLDNVDDDGTVRAGAPLSYTDNGDGTTTDNNTGLLWEQKDDSTGLHDKDNTFRWSGSGSEETIWDWLDDINNTCANDETVDCSTNGDCAGVGGLCGFAGHRDWRIPNVKELHSIVDYGRFNPSIDPIFGLTAATDYWSSTTLFKPAFQNFAWVVNYINGVVRLFTKNVLIRVRAVRGGS